MAYGIVVRNPDTGDIVFDSTTKIVKLHAIQLVDSSNTSGTIVLPSDTVRFETYAVNTTQATGTVDVTISGTNMNWSRNGAFDGYLQVMMF